MNETIYVGPKVNSAAEYLRYRAAVRSWEHTYRRDRAIVFSLAAMLMTVGLYLLC